MTLAGTVVNGQIVFDQPQPLPEGAKVQVLIQLPSPLLVPQDEWERRLRSIATDCGVSLSNEALSREELYD
jgi:hypothetical protein